MELVREFAASQSETAFATLVEWHIHHVHSAAMRQVGDVHLAEEITQSVFIVLAQKAGKLGPNTILPAWLYRATQFAAINALRAQRRRQIREQEAYMQSTLNESEGLNSPSPAPFRKILNIFTPVSISLAAAKSGLIWIPSNTKSPSNQSDFPLISVFLKDNAKQALKKFSEQNIGREVGMTCKGALVSVVIVQDSISGGQLQISGGASFLERANETCLGIVRKVVFKFGM